jgi:iron complex outermembrane receptor protein
MLKSRTLPHPSFSRCQALFKWRALTRISALALAAPHFAQAQAVASEQAAEIPNLEQIVVTGTRIHRQGYESPTPLTVIGSDELAARTATPNVADTLNTLPVFANSQTPASTAFSVSPGTSGINALNLRSVGTNRTLVLIDGQRSVGALLTGVVDVNNIPQQLISRVDVVSGGASAVYGSDAVSGVVNFVLDRKFTGVKAEVAGGIASYGDDANSNASIAAGFPFAAGRGHVLLSGDVTHDDGLPQGGGSRNWAKGGAGIMFNPSYTATNGQPKELVLNNIAADNATPGGIIVSGPLKGIAFGPGGTPYNFPYGPITDDPWTAGGDWQSNNVVRENRVSLEPSETRQGAFFRTSYDVTDNVDVFVQASWNSTYTAGQAFPPYQAGNGPVILTGNPFIPAAVQARMTALNLASFQLGSFNFDAPNVRSDMTRATTRYVVGATGKVDLFATPWTWNAYFQSGESRTTLDAFGVWMKDRYALATNAVRNPATGLIVCASTLTNPTNGCVPWNPLGIGVNNQAAIGYITGGSGDSHGYQTLTQNVYAASAQGEPFSDWAGPVSFAFDVEHRTDSAKATDDPTSLAGDWFAGNFPPINGSDGVTEGAIETVIPLAKEVTFARSWDLSAAARATDYTQSGYVTTWKVGTTYSLIPDFSIRAARSRDIRAPNLQELFQFAPGFPTSGFDPFTNATVQFGGKTAGNPDLVPEKADTTDIGLVLQPSFLSGFSASIDYWSINIKHAISSLNATQILELCFEGLQSECANIQRTNGTVTSVTMAPFNLASLKINGIDFEANYQFKLSDVISTWRGDFAFHGSSTLYIDDYVNSGLPGLGTQQIVGQLGGAQANPGPPRWLVTGTMGYISSNLTTSLTARFRSSGVFDNSYIQCSSNCPTSTTKNTTISDNHIPGYVYLDASVAYAFEAGPSHIETYLNVRNLLNRDPTIVPLGPAGINFVFPITQPSDYDVLGRVFRAGVRIKF